MTKKKRKRISLIGLGLWCLMPLSTSVISWWSVLLVEETGVPRENHWPVASHWKTLSHNVVWRFKLTTLVVLDTADCTGNCKCNYHTIMTMTALIISFIWLTWLSSLSPRGEWGHERVLSILICIWFSTLTAEEHLKNPLEYEMIIFI